MKGSIRNQIRFSAAILLLIFVLISFTGSCLCIRMIGSKYQETISSSALDYAELTVNADKAKASFLTRSRSDDYDGVLSRLRRYQEQHSDAVRRISLVNFNDSAGSYIYDTGGEELGTRLEYGQYTSSIKAELINGRKPMTHREHNILTAYRPIRTVDDALCGYLIVELESPYEASNFGYIAALFGGLLVMGIFIILLFMVYLNRSLFLPIRQITEAAIYLSGNDSSAGNKDASVILNSKREDELGRLSTVLQSIFFSMNTGAEHLSQAIYDANHDGMTQHLNKRSYESMVDSFRSSRTICAVYFDVNNLKLMNDTLGHESGDYVIKQAADYIHKLLNEGDFCFRMGGDEFLLVMPECSFRAVDRLIERLDQDAPYILSREEDSVKCALSYGFAVSAGNRSYDEVLAEAEENMYQKKTELKELLQMPER